ncbi:helix-turn-helix domain-containing protein [Marinicellulosiphila megalodicopiae]|uniref:helix-turn-helix domain-containing protein n=1 Tax=Marinicellulosiphila megalodicopiae TaxID=2724896 RepID=UPI003BAE47AD
MLPQVTSIELQENLAQFLKKQRKTQNISRRELALTSHVPESTIKRFENTGNISLRQFLMLWNSLDKLDRIDLLCINQVFEPLSAQDVLRGNFQ